ncbi:hypothetical protein DOY81_004884 [Sarcophaga bullata]|nr:hypothetical protein DOY81_004884 [Sarcophaga bullata]
MNSDKRTFLPIQTVVYDSQMVCTLAVHIPLGTRFNYGIRDFELEKRNTSNTSTSNKSTTKSIFIWENFYGPSSLSRDSIANKFQVYLALMAFNMFGICLNCLRRLIRSGSRFLLSNLKIPLKYCGKQEQSKYPKCGLFKEINTNFVLSVVAVVVVVLSLFTISGYVAL